MKPAIHRLNILQLDVFESSYNIATLQRRLIELQSQPFLYNSMYDNVDVYIYLLYTLVNPTQTVEPFSVEPNCAKMQLSVSIMLWKFITRQKEWGTGGQGTWARSVLAVSRMMPQNSMQHIFNLQSGKVRMIDGAFSTYFELY